MGRAPCCEKKGLKRGRWTAEEDEILLKYIAENGEGSWKALPKSAGLSRCGKSCRLRWINYLRTGLKRGNISKEEEEIIIKLHSTIGNRWSLIAAQLPGRTDNEIKNYWNSHLSRSIHCFRLNNESQTCYFDSGKRRGGRTSRASMNKTKLFTFKTASTLKDHRQNQNQMTQDNSNLSFSSSSSALTDKECSSPNSDFDFDFDFDMEILHETAGKDGGREGDEAAAVEGGETVKVMKEMEKVLMADLEGFEAKLWENDECELWPWLWEMSGGSGADEQSLELCGSLFF